LCTVPIKINLFLYFAGNARTDNRCHRCRTYNIIVRLPQRLDKTAFVLGETAIVYPHCLFGPYNNNSCTTVVDEKSNLAGHETRLRYLYFYIEMGHDYSSHGVKSAAIVSPRMCMHNYRNDCQTRR